MVEKKVHLVYTNFARCIFVITLSSTNLPLRPSTMPPNADTSILRNRITTKVNAGNLVDTDDAATQSSLRSIKHLKGNEVAIDGIIYDITDFVHPGGEVVKFFGGNDVTVQYKMIHPYHTGKHLEKMKAVGKVVDYVAE